MRFGSPAANAQVNVVVVRFAGVVDRADLLQEVVSALGLVSGGDNGEVIHKETEDAVVALVGVVVEHAWVCG